MERIGEDHTRDGDLNFQTAIRCAKAALLLSSLKEASTAKTVHKLEDIEKIQMLKVELVKEKLKLKNIRRWIGVLLLSYFLVVPVLILLVKFL